MPKTKSKIRVRFAPSPTGFLHVGSLRTALYNYLFARQHNGIFVLRVEDTDKTRYVEGAVENLLKTLRAVGLDWDEGPYIQSERQEIYKKHAQELIDSGHAYYCFCSEDRLTELRRIQELNHQPTKYDGACRQLSPDEIKKKIQAGEPSVVRLAVPAAGETVVEDLVRGRVIFENKLIDDQVLMKSDGLPTYHLANVVDDHLMKITHVIRGEEGLPSTPKHLLLYLAFDWEAPRFAHIPLLLNPDKSKLSKRQGDVAVEDYLKKGYLPEALLNFVTLLGWNPGTEQEIFSVKELIKKFDLAKVHKAGAVFNAEKLNWMNGEYLKKMPLPDLVKCCEPYWSAAFGQEAVLGLSGEQKEGIAALARERLEKLADLPEKTSFFFVRPDYDAKILVWRKSDTATALSRLRTLLVFYDTYSCPWSKERMGEDVLKLIEQENLDNGATLWPMRAALSGREKSPGPFEIAVILGKEETLARLKLAVEKLSP